jgi:hypothetical protein
LRVVTSFHDKTLRSFLKFVRFAREKILEGLLLGLTSLLWRRGTEIKFIK